MVYCSQWCINYPEWCPWCIDHNDVLISQGSVPRCIGHNGVLPDSPS